MKLRIALVAVLATVLAANAAATIYAAATAPTIKACVKSSGAQKGLMRYLASGSCATGEKLLAWNVTGPQGPTGPAGGSGAALVYTNGWQTGQVPVGTAGTWFTLASVAVPAGTYDVRATGWLESTGGGTPKDPRTVSFRCEFASLTWTASWAVPGPPSQRTVAFEDVVTLAQPGEVSFRCTLRTFEQASAATSGILVIASPVSVP